MKTSKRLKWEPAALMVLVLSLGLWVAFGPAGGRSFPTAPGAITSRVLIGETRGVLEAFHPNPASAAPDHAAQSGADEYVFRLWLNDEKQPPRIMTRADAEAFLGSRQVERTLAGRNRLFRTLNITSWYSLVWVGIGLFGQALFSGRMILQWIISEKHKKSVVTESFWWFSLIGGVTLFSYFVWRQDPVAIIGQASGIVVYSRNIRLLRKHARRAAREQISTAAETEPA